MSSSTTSSYNLSYKSTPDINEQDAENNIDDENVEYVEDTFSLSQTANRSTTNNKSSDSAKKVTSSLPQYPGRLFATVCRVKNIEKFTEDFLKGHLASQREIEIQIMQFFVDIAGYQLINVEKFLQKNEVENLVAYMEKFDCEANATEKYFLKSQTHSKKKQCVEQFLETFVINCETTQMIYEHYFGNLVQFVIKMSQSKRRAIKHTGVYIGLKIETGLIRLGTNLSNNMSKYSATVTSVNFNDDQREMLRNKLEVFSEHAEYINNILDFIHKKIYDKNWNFYDSKLHFMRNECIAEIPKWISVNPQRFTKLFCISYIINAIDDIHSVVRLTALNILYSLYENYYQNIKTITSHALEMIFKRINDIKYNVAIRAIELLSLINRHEEVPRTVRDGVCYLIYNHHYPLASAASTFLYKLLKARNVNASPTEDFHKYIAFMIKAKTKKIGENYQFLIECLYDKDPVFLDVSIYMSIIKEYYQEIKEIQNKQRNNNSNGDTIDEDDVNINDIIEKRQRIIIMLINTLTEVTVITFTGKCSISRANPLICSVQPEIAQKYLLDLIPELDTLMEVARHLSITEHLTLLLFVIDKFGMKHYPTTNSTRNSISEDQSTIV